MDNIQLKIDRNDVIDMGEYQLALGRKTYIMGILNVTPDSFSDGGSYIDLERAMEHAKEMILEGADIIDVGGESTRPGYGEVSVEEEISRVLPVVKKLVEEVKAPVSVDTYKAAVAEEVLKAGAHMINDIWGLQRDPNMASVIAKYNVPVVIMHNQNGTEYEGDIMEAIVSFLEKSINIALEAGVEKRQIILDPGIGFGKDLQQNIEVMSRLGELNKLGYPVLLGTSRKSMFGKILDLPPTERLEGTLATTVMGIIQGSDIVRVHDIRANARTIKVTDAIVRGHNHG